MKYRADIDGLRTLAIVPVVLFHAGVSSMSGGFIGVDVFFVISGFLITGILFRELIETGRVSIARFYARRVRRLLPALLIVIAATLILSQFFLPPTGERQSLAISSIAALFFASNFYFWRTQTGYFAESAESLPLLHTWTLAVEEQFYIGWPIMIVLVGFLAFKFGKDKARWLLITITIVGILSFVLSFWLSEARPKAAFFLVVTRAWEFAIGAILAMSLQGKLLPKSKNTGWLVIIGIAAIIYSVFMFDSATKWPGWAALVPTLGTAAIIAGGALSTKPSLMTGFLSTRPMVYVGKLSYSWYLWHWPLLAILHGATLGEQTTLQRIGVVILSFVLSAISYHLIETPIRIRRPGPFKTTFGSLVAGTALLILGTASATVSLAQSKKELGASPQLLAIKKAKSEDLIWPAYCNHFQYPFAGLSPIEACKLGQTDSPNSIMVWGDSHAHHFLPMFDEIGKMVGASVISRTRGGCRPFNGPLGTVGIGRTKALLDDCRAFNEAIAQELKQLSDTGTKFVVIASRWPPNGEDAPIMNTLWESELKISIQAVLETGMKVVLISDGPAFKHSIPECLARRGIINCDISKKSILRNRHQMIQVLTKFADNPNVSLWDPIDSLCKNETCETVNATGAVLYKDSHHLSLQGAQFLANSELTILIKDNLK